MPPFPLLVLLVRGRGVNVAGGGDSKHGAEQRDEWMERGESEKGGCGGLRAWQSWALRWSKRPKHARQICSLLTEWKSTAIQRENDVESNARLQSKV